MNTHLLTSRRRFVTFLSLLFAVLLFASFVLVYGFHSGSAQSPVQGDKSEAKEREIEMRVAAHLPIKVKIKNAEKVKDLKNEAWMSDLEVEVTNTGAKPIYFLYIAFMLPGVFTEDGRETAILGYQLRYGRIQLVDLEERIQSDDVPLLPGESTILKLSSEYAREWKSERIKGKRANPKKLQFWFQLLNHGDGTGYMAPDGIPLPRSRERGSNDSCQEDSEKSSAQVGKIGMLLNRPPNLDIAFASVSLPVNFLTGISFGWDA